MRRIFEWSLAIVGATNGWLVVETFTKYELSIGESLYGLFFAPGIYFLEILLIGILALFSLYKNEEEWLQRLWMANGALLGLVVLGMWSIGPAMILSLICYVLLAISISLALNSSPKNILIQTMKGIGFQIVFMFAVIGFESISILH